MSNLSPIATAAARAARNCALGDHTLPAAMLSVTEFLAGF